MSDILKSLHTRVPQFWHQFTLFFSSCFKRCKSAEVKKSELDKSAILLLIPISNIYSQLIRFKEGAMCYANVLYISNLDTLTAKVSPTCVLVINIKIGEQYNTSESDVERCAKIFFPRPDPGWPSTLQTHLQLNMMLYNILYISEQKPKENIKYSQSHPLFIIFVQFSPVWVWCLIVNELFIWE